MNVVLTVGAAWVALSADVLYMERSRTVSNGVVIPTIQWASMLPYMDHHLFLASQIRQPVTRASVKKEDSIEDSELSQRMW